MIMPLLYNHPLTPGTNRCYWWIKMLLSGQFHPSALWDAGRALRPCSWSPSRVWHHRFLSPLLVPHEGSCGNLSPLLTTPQPEHIQHRDILTGKLQPALIAWVKSESFQMLINWPNLVTSKRWQRPPLAWGWSLNNFLNFCLEQQMC